MVGKSRPRKVVFGKMKSIAEGVRIGSGDAGQFCERSLETCRFKPVTSCLASPCCFWSFCFQWWSCFRPHRRVDEYLYRIL